MKREHCTAQTILLAMIDLGESAEQRQARRERRMWTLWPPARLRSI